MQSGPTPGDRRARRQALSRRRRQRRGVAIGSVLGVVLLAAVVLSLVMLPLGSSHRGTSSRRVSATRDASRTRSTDARSAGPATFPGPDGVEARWVIEQNKLPGTTAWKITTPQTPGAIEGYANRTEARLGQTVHLYVSTTAKTFRVEAFRMGYYQGKGARLVWESKVLPGKVQPSCPVTPGVNMVSCNWSSSLRFRVTKAFVQGQYLFKLVGSGGQQSYIPFTIWDPASRATYVIMDGNITWQVFNPFGGYDLYQGATPCAPNHYPCSTRARIVSFDRPYGYGNGAASYLSLVYPLTRFAEKHGLNVTYWTDITLARHGNLLERHRVLISPGHDEEWSLRMRDAVVRARADGVNLIFFGASPILRKVRLEPSPLGQDMEVVNYRNPYKDPLYGKDNAEVTQNWWGQPPAEEPASTVVGAKYIGFNNYKTFPLVVSNASSWLFAGTGLTNGESIPGVLTTDFDAYDPSRANNPPNVEIMAHSPVVVEFHPHRNYADTTYYTWPSSGAGVFESGANSWIPSLDTCSSKTDCPAPLMRRITGNLLRLFGRGPAGHFQPSVGNTSKFYG